MPEQLWLYNRPVYRDEFGMQVHFAVALGYISQQSESAVILDPIWKKRVIVSEWPSNMRFSSGKKHIDFMFVCIPADVKVLKKGRQQKAIDNRHVVKKIAVLCCLLMNEQKGSWKA